MHFRYTPVPDWPPLAWLACGHRGDPTVEVFHGPDVETTPDGFSEAVWDGEFARAGFDETDLVFGSGARRRGVPRVPRGVPRGPGAESELVRSRRPVADARYHLERVRFARGDRTGAAVWAARGDRVRAVEQRRTRQRRRDRPGRGRATPPSGPRRLARPGRSRGA